MRSGDEMKEERQAALEILRRAQNPFTPGSAEHWALHVMQEAFEKGERNNADQKLYDKNRCL